MGLSVAHAFNPSTEEGKADGSLNSRPVSSTKRVPGKSWLYTKKPYLEATPPPKIIKEKKKKKEKHTVYSCRGPEFNSQHPHRRSQPSMRGI